MTDEVDWYEARMRPPNLSLHSGADALEANECPTTK